MKQGMMRYGIAGLTMFLFAATGWAQFINDRGPMQQPGKTAAVEFVAPDQIAVPASKPTKVLLHFRVQPGLHVNSHTPKDEFLIPTAFTIVEGKGVHLESVAYPAGHDVTLPADPKTKLNVYTGDFALDAAFVATAGEHVVQGKLRYQACDQRQCMPPKTIAVVLVVTGS